MSDLFLVIAIVSALVGGVTSGMIGGELQKRGVKVNWFLYRVLLMTRYLGEYKDLTRKETGRVGTLYYVFVTAWNVALVMAVVGLLLRGS
jgi:hypothetical protein